MNKITKNSVFALMLSAPALFGAEPFLKADFNTPGNLQALINGKPYKVTYASSYQKHQTPDNTGVKGRAVLFAKDNLQDFQELVSGLNKTLMTLRYDKLSGIPAEKGFADFYIMPYFNEISKSKVPHNYAFRLYCREGRKQTLTVFITSHKQVNVQFDFANGQKSYMYYYDKNWQPKVWRRITLRWDKNLQQLYVDGKLAAQKNVDGTLMNADRLELGGKDGAYQMFQGLIDEVYIGEDAPEGITLDDKAKKKSNIIKNEGDPAAFGPVAGSKITLDPQNWQNVKGVSAAAENGKLVLNYEGGDFKYRTIFGPEIKVDPDSVIRGDLSFRKKKWDYAVYAPACVAFFDKNGKQLYQSTGYDGTAGTGMRFDESNIRKGYSPMRLQEFTQVAGLNRQIDYFNYWKVPANAVTMRPGWTFAYNPCSVEVSRLDFRTVDPKLKSWQTQPAPVRKKANVDRGITDAEAVKIIAKRPRAEAKVARDGDRTELYINGKKTLPAFMHNTMYNIKNVPFYSHTFDKMGFPISTVWVSLGNNPRSSYRPFALKEDGSIDITPWRNAVREIIRQAPDGYVMLALYIFPTMRWLEENPEELMADGEGKKFIFGYPYYPLGKGASNTLPKGYSRYPSLYSKKYMEYISKVLGDVLKEFEKTPESKVVIGAYLLGGDDAQFRLPNIAFTPDLSLRAKEGFREYLRTKYGNDNNLRKEWRDQSVSIDTVEPPLRNELWANRPYYSMGHSSRLSDYKSCYAMSDRIFKTAIRKAAKEAVPRMLIGGYDCAYGIGGSWGHTGLHFAKGIEDAADFYINIPSYSRERDNGDITLRPYQFTGSLAMRGKLSVFEMDVRNPMIPSLYFGHYRSRNWQESHNYRTFSNALTRLAATAVATGGGFHYYNLQPHWILSQEAQDALKRARDIAANRKGENFDPEQVAVFIDEDSNLYSSLNPHWVPSFFNIKTATGVIQHSGFRYNNYLLRDVFHKDFKAPKMLLFGDAGTLTPEEVKEVRNRFGRDGRVIVWHGCPGFLASDDYGKISDALGFKVTLMGDKEKTPLVVSDAKHPVMKNISGFFMQEPNFLPYVASPSWKVEDGEIVARYHTSNIPGMSVKRYKNHTEVFIGHPGSISPALIRNMAAMAGMKPYIDTDDIFVYGGSLMVISASLGDGVRTVRIPDNAKKVTVLTGHKVTNQDKKSISIDIPFGESAVLLVEKE